MSTENNQASPARTADELGADLLAAKRKRVAAQAKHAATLVAKSTAEKELDDANKAVQSLDAQYQAALQAQN